MHRTAMEVERTENSTRAIHVEEKQQKLMITTARTNERALSISSIFPRHYLHFRG